MFVCPSHCFGPTEELRIFQQFVEKTMVVKVSVLIEIGAGSEHPGARWLVDQIESEALDGRDGSSWTV